MSTAQRPIQSPRGAGMVWVSDLITYWEAGSCAKQTCAPTVSGQRVHPAGLYITHRCSVSLFNKQRALSLYIAWRFPALRTPHHPPFATASLRARAHVRCLQRHGRAARCPCLARSQAHTQTAGSNAPRRHCTSSHPQQLSYPV